LQSLKKENRDNDPKQHALSPKGVKVPQGAVVFAQVESVEESFFNGQVLPVGESKCAQSEPNAKEHKAPAALAQKNP
jgi:hypothetical protein